MTPNRRQGVKMLPFLKNKKQPGIAGVIVKTRISDEKPDEQEDDKDAGMKACASDLINAIHAKDITGTMEALRAAFELADSEPHVEGEHIEPHSYEAQNKKAGE